METMVGPLLFVGVFAVAVWVLNRHLVKKVPASSFGKRASGRYENDFMGIFEPDTPTMGVEREAYGPIKPAGM